MRNYIGLLVVMTADLQSVLCKHISANPRNPIKYLPGLASPEYVRRLTDYYAFSGIVEATEAIAKSTLSLSQAKGSPCPCCLGIVTLNNPTESRKIKQLESLTRLYLPLVDPVFSFEATLYPSIYV